MVGTCVICGGEFYIKNPRKPASTCSRPCTNKMVWKEKSDRKTGPKPQERIIADCAYCGKPVKRAQRPGRQGKYCSRKCTGRAKGRSAIYISPNGRARVNLRDGSKQWYARCLMEGHLKRHLQPSEIVHHINEDPSDDRIENLEIVTPAEHARKHGPAGGTYGKLSAEVRRAIVASDDLPSALAREFGVTPSAIRYHRKKAGLPSLLKSQGRIER